MSKANIHYNSADHDEVPPPPYTESQNSAYNPNYGAAASSPYAASNSGDTVPSAPPLPQEQQQPSPSSPSNLYPTLPVQQQQPPYQYQHYQQQQQQQAQQQQQQHYQSGNHYHYQAINIPPPVSHGNNNNHRYRARETIIRYQSSHEPAERNFPIAALLFLFGWFCPFLWFVGACCCSGRRNPYEAWWGKANTVMALLFILSSIMYSMVAVSSGDWLVGLRLLDFSTV